jgi:hypothetical protein
MLSNEGPAPLAGGNRVGIECPEQQFYTTIDALTPVATPSIGASTLMRVSAGGRLPRDHAALARDLLKIGFFSLTAWERDFLGSFSQFKDLSKKQWRVLRQICREIYAAQIRSVK